jgi:ATP-dependent DNA ligase
MSRTYPLDEILLPMGGTTVKDREKMDEIWESDEYVAEEKYDGSRYLNVGGRFFSRRVSVVDNLPVEKTENVPHLKEVLKNYPLLILDGEIYIEGAKSNEVVSIMGAKPEKAIARQQERGNVSYVVYDILRDADGNWLTELPWTDRRGILEEQMEIIFTDHPSCEVHISLSDYTLTDKKQFNAEIMKRGGEGVMLKNINGKYFPDKKPRWNWIKVKQEITSDVIITGFKDPVREYTGKEIETWQ